jgi:hypothetical protein
MRNDRIYYLDTDNMATIDMRSVAGIAPPLSEKGSKKIKGKEKEIFEVSSEVHEGILTILREFE